MQSFIHQNLHFPVTVIYFKEFLVNNIISLLSFNEYDATKTQFIDPDISMRLFGNKIC